MKKFLIIQTAFIGDVILATSIAEKLHQHFPDASIDFLLRKGNESLLENHPFIHEVIVWNKKQNKLSNLLKIISNIRKSRYDAVINLHRFTSSGLITALSGAKEKIGFDKNPFSFLLTKKVHHEIGNAKHEIERNHELIAELTDAFVSKPKLYPSVNHFSIAENLESRIKNQESEQTDVANRNTQIASRYICIAPTSVWFTKQFPKEKWIELINLLPEDIIVYLLGSKSDVAICEAIQSKIKNQKSKIRNVAGQLSFLESAALMKGAKMNYVNDSAPMHIASAMNAPVTAVFCSTIPAFGFGPLSDQSKIVETKVTLDCRPCGLHGFKTCPKGHFNCALTIEMGDVV